MAKQKVYLSGYLALVFFSLSGLILQGGVYILVGIACWSCVFLGCINYYNKSGNAKPLKNNHANTMNHIREEKARALCGS
jgi:hypothetical protein